MSEVFRLPLQSPLAILVLTLCAAASGTFLSDRIVSAKDNSAAAIRVEQLDRRMTKLEGDTLPRSEEKATLDAIHQRLDDLKQDLRDIKDELKKR